MIFQNVFESFGERNDPIGIYPDFQVRVIACKIPPTHLMFRDILDISRGIIERLFAGQSLGRTAIHPTFIFPERWMTPEQTRIRVIDVITASPVILTDVTHSMIRIVEEHANTSGNMG